MKTLYQFYYSSCSSVFFFFSPINIFLESVLPSSFSQLLFQLKLLQLSLLKCDNLIIDNLVLFQLKTSYILLPNSRWLFLHIKFKLFCLYFNLSYKLTQPTYLVLFYSSQCMHSVWPLSFLPPLHHSLSHTILCIPFAKASSLLLLCLSINYCLFLECHLHFYAQLSYISFMKIYHTVLARFLFFTPLRVACSYSTLTVSLFYVYQSLLREETMFMPFLYPPLYLLQSRVYSRMSAQICQLLYFFLGIFNLLIIITY